MQFGRSLSAGLALAALASTAMAEPPADAARDWPCKQILVERVSLPAVWTGPPIDGIDWRKDEAVAALVAQTAPRRTPVEAATAAIDAFAASAGAQKEARLTALFAGLFETLDAERTSIIDGLRRFGRKQKELAAKIRAENAALQKSLPATPAPGVEPANDPATQALQWDLRLFDERRKSLAFACEAPTLVEQRLFALARAIQYDMD